MKAYCINLDRRPDRLAHMTAEFARAGIPFERIPAVDGQDPAVAAAAARLPLSSLNNKRISTGAHGCMQSHRAVWRQLIDSGESWGMIFEDDLVLAPDMALYLHDGWVPKDADIVKLETFRIRLHISRKHQDIGGGRRVARLCATHLGTGCYVISAVTAQRLLSETAVCGDAIDEFLFNVQLPFFHSARIYQMCPAPVIQGDRAEVTKQKLHSGWQATSIVDRLASVHVETDVAPETPLHRLWRRGREEIRARVRGTRYVVVPHG